ncbi:related to PPX1 - exopolyphosphatase [Melanopsichium pennsylvanicum]|uniref:Related to PPX1 - exopolyphosphatase n=2 Tax=Melanopsichium pennsylvanicum TaxID=63383 RepID=A0AAJ4XTA6_9BASI|nr:related to PPX1-exopolyphosphatase [Melanopsichium pennsylvanicum 4]SNX87671.1 related to PPX1 - exopolyphosphatase [Melanopsichium pennsylvanicum]
MTASSSAPVNGTKLLNLDEYLAQAKQDAYTHLKAGSSSQTKLTVIMGNEAGDLDSAACAIGLSYLLTRFGSPSGHNLSESKYVPLIQSSHKDDVLRPENTAAFRASQIDPESVLCLDDVQHKLGLSLESEAFAPSANVAIGLVDHASLTGPWGGARAGNRDVQIVVDHHEDVGDHTNAALRIIKSPSKEPIGSCSSMVAELFASDFAKSPSTDLGLRQVADLLISAIIIDTDNLRSAPGGKATRADFEAVKLLFPYSSFGNPSTSARIKETALWFSPLNRTDHASVEPIQAINPSEDTDSATRSAKIILAPYWQILSGSKQAVSHLSGRDLLRRDYKQLDVVHPEGYDAANADVVLKLGFASVPISIVEWLHKDRPTPKLVDAADAKQEVKEAWAVWWKVLDEFMAERKIDIAVMTGSFRVAQGEVDAGKHKRELVLAFAPRMIESTQASIMWDELRKGLEMDAHVAADEVDRRLMLEEPWKGQRLPESAGGKRERVKGVDSQGKREDASADKPRWAKVYRQANARANRKIVLPAVTTILKAAVRKL